MKYRCYPLKREVKSGEYLFSIAALLAGLALIVFSFHSEWFDGAKGRIWIAGISFIAGIGLIVYACENLRTYLEGLLPLAWDEAELRWGFRKQKWTDLPRAAILNEITRDSVFDKIVDFKRFLVFSDLNGKEQMRVPFYRTDYISGKGAGESNPIWQEFLHTIERRYSFTAELLAGEQAASQDSAREYAKESPPGKVIGVLIGGCLSLLLILLITEMEAFYMKGFLAGYFLACMAVVWYGKKIGWAKFLQYFQRRHFSK